jgi:GAF domain-containing protein/HAMP domain-containing protein
MASSSGQKVPFETRQSIRTRVLLLLLGLTTAAVVGVGYLGVSSVQRIGASARQTSASALRVQAAEYLRQVTRSDVQKNDLVLAGVERDAMKVAQYAARLFENPDAFAGGAYWRAEDHMFVASDGQYMNGEEDASSAFVPAYVTIDEEIDRALELGAYLDLVFAPTHESNPNTVAIYLGTERETTQYYPNISLGSLVPPDFTVTERPWYVSAAPENNPERQVAWSPIYVDATGQGLMVTAAAPVYDKDEFVGAVGIDVTLQDISASVEETRLLGSGYGFLIDNEGQAIALPEQGYRDILARDPEPDEVGADLSASDTAFASILAEMMAGSEGFDTLTIGDKELFVAYAPLEATGWSLANVVETRSVLQSLASLEADLDRSTRSLVLARVLPLGAAILAIVGAVGLLIARRLTHPIQEMVTAAQRIGAGQWDVPLPRTRNDEIGVLADAFAHMTEQLRDLYGELEDKVAAQTRDLRERAIRLETSARVAREAAAIQDVDQLLTETVHLISDRFGFYHAGIFLLDETAEYAVLRAASSEGGQRMLARRHSLKVGEVGIVGYVAGAAEPRIALDVGQDAVFFDNPDLPDTRSEMALPLQARGQLIGVLDVQSVEAAAFDDEDVAVLQTMADQVALAIDNARLLEEAEERVEEIQSLLRRESREGWERIAGARLGWGYAYDGTRVVPQPRDQARSPALAEEEAQLTVPLRVRGASIGKLKLKLGDRSPTAEEEVLIQEVLDQASQALESARLFQETQRALSETEVLYRASEAIGAADSPHGLLRAITDHVLSPQIDRCVLALVDAVSPTDDPAVVVEAAWEPGIDEPDGIGERWSARERPGALRLPILREILSLPSPESDTMPRYVFSDVANSTELGDVSRQALGEKLGIKAVSAIPLFAGQRPLGLLLIQSLDAPYEFSEREIRLYQTLADQAAVALEGMRLLEETRRRAERERLTAEISSRVRASADVDAVLRTAVRELGRSLRASDAWIELELEDGNGASGGVQRLDDLHRMTPGGDGDGALRGSPHEGEE